MRIKDKTIFKWKQAKTYEYCLGIDLALRRSGVALLRKNYEFIMSDYFDTSHNVDNLINLSDEVTTKFISILEPYKEELKDCCVVIEHSAFSWKFTLMLGMVTNILTNYFQVIFHIFHNQDNIFQSFSKNPYYGFYILSDRIHELLNNLLYPDHMQQ